MPDLYSRLGVLRTESSDELAGLLADITQDIEPKSSVEKLYVSDIAYHTWDVLRYRRIKNGIMKRGFRKALVNILNEILLPPSPNYFLEQRWAAETLAYDASFDEESWDRTLSVMQEAGLDETAIEAEAYRLVADDLAKADRMLKAAEDGREKALRSIKKYRKSFGEELRRKSDRVLAEDDVPSVA